MASGAGSLNIPGLVIQSHQHPGSQPSLGSTRPAGPGGGGTQHSPAPPSAWHFRSESRLAVKLLTCTSTFWPTNACHIPGNAGIVVPTLQISPPRLPEETPSASHARQWHGWAWAPGPDAHFPSAARRHLRPASLSPHKGTKKLSSVSRAASPPLPSVQALPCPPSARTALPTGNPPTWVTSPFRPGVVLADWVLSVAEAVCPQGLGQGVGDTLARSQHCDLGRMQGGGADSPPRGQRGPWVWKQDQTAPRLETWEAVGPGLARGTAQVRAAGAQEHTGLAEQGAASQNGGPLLVFGQK